MTMSASPPARSRHGFQCRHVNIALPPGAGQDRIPDLLRAAAATIEEMELEGPVGVMDVLLHFDPLEAGAMRPHVTLYYYFPEEDEDD